MPQETMPSRPGEKALENMKLLKTESTVFKVPKVPRKPAAKKKENVLDEDVYVEGIAKIIQRDFFPDLEKLNAQNDFLEATENKDYARLQEITRKYSGRRPPTEPYNSPATFDTPERMQSPAAPTVRQHRAVSVEPAKDKPADITNHHTLDSFLATHTSEDNASYDRVISLEDKKRRTKLASQFEAEVTSAGLCEAALALPSIEQQADQTNRPDELDTWRFKARNHIMYVPDGSGQPPTPKPELQHHNTRLRAEPFDHQRYKETISQLAKNQDTIVSGRIGVDGSTLGAAPAAPGAAPGYALVATPSPRPGAGPDASPLMTWGEIEGEPFRLDGGDTPAPNAGCVPAYRMLSGGARERLGLRLAEQAAQRRRRPTTPGIHREHTPSFRTNTERLASMSPAARRLATKHLLTPKLKLTPNMGIFDPATPKRTSTPMRRLVTPQGRLVTPTGQARLVTPTGKRSKNITTPSSEGSVNNSTNMTEKVDSDNLTDNLLQINVPKRSRVTAADFFR